MGDNGREWKELNVQEKISPGKTNHLSLILDFEEKRYKKLIFNEKEIDFNKPLAISNTEYDESIQPSTRIHFEYRPKVDGRTAVAYDNILLKYTRVF